MLFGRFLPAASSVVPSPPAHSAAHLDRRRCATAVVLPTPSAPVMMFTGIGSFCSAFNEYLVRSRARALAENALDIHAEASLQNWAETAHH